jgi:hypothetical protein
VVGSPFFHEGFQLLIRRFGQDDAERDDLITGRARRTTGQSLPPQPQRIAGVRACRNGHRDLAGHRRHGHFCTEYRLVYGNWQIHMNVCPLAPEQRVRRDMHFDISITIRPAPDSRPAFAAQPKYLRVPLAGRDRNFEGIAVRHRNALFRASGGFEKRYFHRVARVPSPHPDVSTPAARARGTTGPFTEKIGKDVPDIVETGGRRIGLFPAGARVLAVILLRRLVTFRVDLAGIELAALFRIGQDIVRALDILECLFRRSIAGVEIRMMLLRKRPVGLANDFGRCVARDAENGIQVGFVSSQYSSPHQP